MSEIDYKQLGFKCGLEIHQQLDTGKLFCNCPTLNSTKKTNTKAMRVLRATQGETGEIDTAAAYEMQKGKYFEYVSHSEDTCLIDYDEEPITEMNLKALEAALHVALLLNAEIVDEVQVMRKIVVDGSNVSGFQRTSLIALDGSIQTSKGKVGIETICLEEEAAQKLETKENATKYKLDRLGIPLIEIATDASIKDPEHAKEVAAYIGMVLRSVQYIKRGLGTIRQDVNVSLKQSARTEIKGFQDLRSIPKVIVHEVYRHLSEIKKGNKLEKQVRKAESDFTTSFLRPMPGAARMYPETDALPARISKQYIDQVKKTLPTLLSDRIKTFKENYNLNDNLAKELLEHSEFEGYVKQFPNIDPSFIAKTLVDTPKEIKKRYNIEPSKLLHEHFKKTLSLLNTKKITKEVVIDILVKKAQGEKINLEDFKTISDEELEMFIQQQIKKNPNLRPNAYMGLVMAQYRGKVNGKKVMQMISNLLRK